MDLDMKGWMEAYIRAVTAQFGARARFIGLQGSRGRGEAGPDSDIDVVAVLDCLDAEDLERYKRAVADLPRRELLCGFVCGREELTAWDPADRFSLYYDTTPYLGKLDFFPAPGREEAAAAVRTGACGIYHACAHTILHGSGAFGAQYKSAVFILQAKYFRDRGVFIRRHRELAQRLEGTDRAVFETVLDLRAGRPPDMDRDVPLLFAWAGKLLCDRQ